MDGLCKMHVARHVVFSTCRYMAILVGVTVALALIIMIVVGRWAIMRSREHRRLQRMRDRPSQGTARRRTGGGGLLHRTASHVAVPASVLLG